MAKVSCLMVTKRKAKFPLLQKAVKTYLNQSYPDRELVIVCDGDDREYKTELWKYVASLNRSDITALLLSGNNTLGWVRNLSVRRATGDYVCQWDDDDLYHPKRLEVQMKAIAEVDADACFCHDHFHYYYDTKQLLYVNWGEEVTPFSIVARRELVLKHPYPEKGEIAARGEDDIVRNALLNYNCVRLSDQGHLFVYTFSGNNTWHRDHHACGVDGKQIVKKQQSWVKQRIAEFGVDLPYTYEGLPDPKPEPEKKAVAAKPEPVVKMSASEPSLETKDILSLTNNFRWCPILFNNRMENLPVERMYRGAVGYIIAGGVTIEQATKMNGITLAIDQHHSVMPTMLWTSVRSPKEFDRKLWNDATVTKYVPGAYLQEPVSGTIKVEDCPNTFFYRRNDVFRPEQFFEEASINCGGQGDQSSLLAAIRLLYFLGCRTLVLVADKLPESETTKVVALSKVATKKNLEICTVGCEIEGIEAMPL